MAFREKVAWISLISMTAIYGSYFWSVVHSGPGAGSHVRGLLGTVIALVVVQVLLLSGVAVAAPKEAKAPQDERDRLIELRSTRFAYYCLAASVACAVFFGGFDPPTVFNTNALLFILVACEIMRCSCQVILYRRSA